MDITHVAVNLEFERGEVQTDGKVHGDVRAASNGSSGHSGGDKRVQIRLNHRVSSSGDIGRGVGIGGTDVAQDSRVNAC